MLSGGRSGTCCYAVSVVGVCLVSSSWVLAINRASYQFCLLLESDQCRTCGASPTTAAGCYRFETTSQGDLASLKKWDALCVVSTRGWLLSSLWYYYFEVGQMPIKPNRTPKISKLEKKYGSSLFFRWKAIENDPLQQSFLGELLTASLRNRGDNVPAM